MGKIISIVNQKGGVGKTTTAVNLSAALTILEKKVLVIDADPQANATSGLGISLRNIEKNFYHCLIEGVKISEALLETEDRRMKICPSHIDLVGAELELIQIPDREKKLSVACEGLKDMFDYIIIDCSPSLGLITLNALTASDSVIIPVQCEFFALEGLGKLLNTIKIVQDSFNSKLEIEGILLTMYDKRLRISNQVVEDVREHFQDSVFNTIIHRTTKLSEAPSFGQSIFALDSASKGAQNYLNFAAELLKA